MLHLHSQPRWLHQYAMSDQDASGRQAHRRALQPGQLTGKEAGASALKLTPPLLHHSRPANGGRQHRGHTTSSPAASATDAADAPLVAAEAAALATAVALADASAVAAACAACSTGASCLSVLAAERQTETLLRGHKPVHSPLQLSQRLH